MSGLHETTPICGFHILFDCNTRTYVVAFFDGKWWLPGSDIAFDASDIRLPDQHNYGRFNYSSAINVPEHAYGPWKVTNGRFR